MQRRFNEQTIPVPPLAGLHWCAPPRACHLPASPIRPALPSISFLRTPTPTHIRRLCEDKGGDGAHAVELQLGKHSQLAANTGDEAKPFVLRFTPDVLTLLRSELLGARDLMAALPR